MADKGSGNIGEKDHKPSKHEQQMETAGRGGLHLILLKLPPSMPCCHMLLARNRSSIIVLARFVNIPPLCLRTRAGALQVDVEGGGGKDRGTNGTPYRGGVVESGDKATELGRRGSRVQKRPQRNGGVHRVDNQTGKT